VLQAWFGGLWWRRLGRWTNSVLGCLCGGAHSPTLHIPTGSHPQPPSAVSPLNDEDGQRASAGGCFAPSPAPAPMRGFCCWQRRSPGGARERRGARRRSTETEEVPTNQPEQRQHRHIYMAAPTSIALHRSREKNSPLTQ
jgi:hypothetical protein